jgi:endonuclease III
MTMILSERSDDLKLSRALGRLFRLYPDLADLRGWSKRQIIDRILVRKDKGGCGFGGYGKPHGGGNEDRLYSFMDLYFNTWEQKITEQNIDDLETLPPGSGFGPKFTRTLRAYCFGNSRVLPLDTPGFEFLKRRYPPCAKSTIDEVRNHIEEMLSSEESVSLIDFHELLRFRGQTDGKPINGTEYENIVVGWNAWRLLCSNKRTEITEDWICARLITGREDLAKKLWRFFKEITAL